MKNIISHIDSEITNLQIMILQIIDLNVSISTARYVTKKILSPLAVVNVIHHMMPIDYAKKS